MSIGGLFGGTKYEPDYTAQRELAGVSREMQDDYTSRFLPIETRLSDDLKKSYKTHMMERPGMTLEPLGTGLARGTFNRDLGRAGLTLTEDHLQDASSRFQRRGALNTVHARNRDRKAFFDRKNIALSSMTSAGRNLAQQGLSNLSQVAGMESARNQQNALIAAQNYQSNMGIIGAVLGGLSLFL